MRISRLSLEAILGKIGKRVGVVNLWSIHPLPSHPLRVKFEICWRISKVRCYKLFPYKWKLCTLRDSRSKQGEPWPFSVLDAPGSTLGVNVHTILLKVAQFEKKTISQTTSPLCLDSKLDIKELKGSLRGSPT